MWGENYRSNLYLYTFWYKIIHTFALNYEVRRRNMSTDKENSFVGVLRPISEVLSDIISNRFLICSQIRLTSTSETFPSQASAIFAMRMVLKQALLDLKAIRYFPSVHISPITNHRSFLKYHHHHHHPNRHHLISEEVCILPHSCSWMHNIAGITAQMFVGNNTPPSKIRLLSS